MQRMYIKCLLTVLMGFSVNVSAQQLRAYLSYATFFAPGSGPYVETYLAVNGYSVKYAPTGKGTFQSKLEVQIKFTKNDSVVYSDKYYLDGPELQDTNATHNPFIDQQRVSLKNGKYLFTISIADANSNQKPFITTDTVTILFNSTPRFSDIQLLEDYTASLAPSKITKSGHDLKPFVSSFFPTSVGKIKFYSEFYGNEELATNGYLIRYYIVKPGYKVPVNDLYKQRVEKGQNIAVVLDEFDIKDLPTGNYSLVMDARSKENKQISFAVMHFQRYNVALAENQIKQDSAVGSIDDIVLSKTEIVGTFVDNYNNRDTLREYLRCLRPILKRNEVIYIAAQIKLGDVPKMKRYFYAFWKARNPKNPELAWLQYKDEIRVVQEEFGSRVVKGYDTDRGRVYLQYGKPNSISSVNSDSELYPYEIWHYYTLSNNQRNKKFVFYNPDLVTNDYSLIHSNALGEKNDPQWQYMLFKRTKIMDDIDRTDLGNEKLNNLFDNPR